MMMKIKFVYASDCPPDPRKQKLITKVCNEACLHLRLPTRLTVQLLSMGDHVYGETMLDPRMLDTIRINYDLLLKDLIYPDIHELIHIDQIVSGKLSASKSGKVIWEGKAFTVKNGHNLSHEQYMSLPWEEDVSNRIEELFAKILNL